MKTSRLLTIMAVVGFSLACSFSSSIGSQPLGQSEYRGTPTTTPGPTCSNWVVSSQTLELRDGPGENHRTLDWLSNGSRLMSCSVQIETSDGYCQRWLQVDRPIRAWVCMKYLNRVRPAGSSKTLRIP